MTTAAKPLYRRRWFLIGAIAVGVPILALAWYLGSPLLLNKTVVEEFPQVAASPDNNTGPAATAPNTTASPSSPAAPTTTDGTPADPTTAPTTSPPTTTAVPAEPVALLTGEFRDADAFHQGSGTATIHQLADGSRVLRFESLDVTNGPDLHVFVSPVVEVTSNDDVMATGYVDLGELKGNRGDQNYELPTDLSLDGPVTVVIYCVPFHVIFSTAQLASAS
jgi:Electron transfer DM13